MTESRRRVLVVDDESSIRDSLELLLKPHFDVSTAEHGAAALDLIGDETPDLMLLDVTMPRLSGLETLKAIRDRSLNFPVIMLTAMNTVKIAVEAMKLGAADFVNKPFDIEELTSIIVRTLEISPTTVRSEGQPTREAHPLPPGDFGPLVGKSQHMHNLFAQVSQIAERDTTVLITGESGTGKELIAHQMHQLSSRKAGPFVAINCAAIPETLIESELFGHERGAFTHAVERRIGHCELADNGTLFLDEIGDLSLAVQVKMLRFLQEQEFFRVGRSKPTRVNVRIITATNKNLEQLVREGKFRQDLFYRINVINLALPPLRERYEDVPHLIEHFIGKFAARYGGRALQFSADAMNALIQYSWPGNVRELENVVESLIALTPHDTVSEDDLPRKVRFGDVAAGVPTQIFEGSLKFEDAERLFERDMILKALRKTNNVQTRAAELLGISRRILKYKMDKLGITEELAAQAVASAESGGAPLGAVESADDQVDAEHADDAQATIGRVPPTS